MTALTTGKRIIFCGRYEKLLQTIAAQVGCQAHVMTNEDFAAQHDADELAEFVARWDSHQPAGGDTPPLSVADMAALDAGTFDLINRQDEILKHYKEATEEERTELINELAEIENKLD